MRKLKTEHCVAVERIYGISEYRAIIFSPVASHPSQIVAIDVLNTDTNIEIPLIPGPEPCGDPTALAGDFCAADEVDALAYPAQL